MNSIAPVSLDASTNAGLLSLQQAGTTLSTTELGLETGDAVGSSFGNATVYAQSASFLNTASSLGSIEYGLSTALATLQTASNGLGSISGLVSQLQEVASAAQQSSNATTRASYATQFNALLTQIDNLAGDSAFNGTNLLQPGTTLQVSLGASPSDTLNVQSIDASSAGLGLSAASNGFASDSDVNAALTQLQNTQSTLSAATTSFGDNADLIQTSQSFNFNQIDTLQEASSNLVQGNAYTQAADLQAAQTQSQLGVIALGISHQQSQTILQLFG